MMEVTSTDVIFDLKNDHLIPYSLGVKNLTTQLLAFKIRSTNPNVFVVKPSRGIINQFQRETIEFSLINPSQNPKSIVNEKFQIQAIKINEKKSFAEIDVLFRTAEIQTIKLCTCVLKEELGKKVQVHNEKLVDYDCILAQSKQSKSELTSTMYSMIRPDNEPTTPQIEIIEKINQLDQQILDQRNKREQLFNEQSQVKNVGSKSMNTYNNRNNDSAYSTWISDFQVIHLFVDTICMIYELIMKQQQQQQYKCTNQCNTYQSLPYCNIQINVVSLGITIIRNVEWDDTIRDRQQNLQIGIFMIIVPIMYVITILIRLLFVPSLQTIYNQQLHYYPKQHQQITKSTSSKKQQQEQQIKSKITTKSNKRIKVPKQVVEKPQIAIQQITTTISQDVTQQDIDSFEDVQLQEHQQEQVQVQEQIQSQQSVQSTIISEQQQLIVPSNSQPLLFNIKQILSVIDSIPTMSQQVYNKFSQQNKINRRQYLQNNISLNDYINSIMELIEFIDNLLYKTQQMVAHEKSLDYGTYLLSIKQLIRTPNHCEEIQSHMKYIKQLLESQQPISKRLLLKDGIIIYQYLYELITLSNEQLVAIVKIALSKLEYELQLNYIIGIYLDDIIWLQYKYEKQDRISLLNTFTNNIDFQEYEEEIENRLVQFIEVIKSNTTLERY